LEIIAISEYTWIIRKDGPASFKLWPSYREENNAS